MAKGKRSKGRNYVSKGERPSVKAETLKGMKRERTYADKMLNKVRAWRKGKRITVTLENTETRGSNHRFKKMSGIEAWGDPNWKPEKKSKRKAQPAQEFVDG